MNTSSLSQEIEQSLFDKITLFKHLGIYDFRIEDSAVDFKVSLEKSRNHKGTAFGGSLYADAVLAAYSLVLSELRRNHIATSNIVIASAEIKYLKPVDSDFLVQSHFLSSGDREVFLRQLKETKKSKIKITSQVYGSDQELKAELIGLFVIRDDT